MNEFDANRADERPDHGEVPLTRKVSRMGMLIHRYYEANAQRHGAMGDPLRGQGRVLALLAAKPTTTQRELSFLLDMRQQSLSELLAKLEEKGFITREKSAEDGRVTVVKLTEEGATAAPSPEQMQDRADALDCLNEEEQSQLEALTAKVTASLEEKLQAMGIDPHMGPRGPKPHGEGRDDGPQGRGPKGGFGGGRGRGRDGRGDDGPRGRSRDGRVDDQRGRGPKGGYGNRDRDRSDRDRGDRDRGRNRGPYRPHDGGGSGRRGPYRPYDDKDSDQRGQRRNDGFRDDHRMRQA